jgi:hypothetical protein
MYNGVFVVKHFVMYECAFFGVERCGLHAAYIFWKQYCVKIWLGASLCMIRATAGIRECFMPQFTRYAPYLNRITAAFLWGALACRHSGHAQAATQFVRVRAFLGTCT